MFCLLAGDSKYSDLYLGGVGGIGQVKRFPGYSGKAASKVADCGGHAKDLLRFAAIQHTASLSEKQGIYHLTGGWALL